MDRYQGNPQDSCPWFLSIAGAVCQNSCRVECSPVLWSRRGLGMKLETTQKSARIDLLGAEWNMDIFFSIWLGNVIIPVDELIFFRGLAIPPTSDDHSNSKKCWTIFRWIWSCLWFLDVWHGFTKVVIAPPARWSQGTMCRPTLASRGISGTVLPEGER